MDVFLHSDSSGNLHLITTRLHPCVVLITGPLFGDVKSCCLTFTSLVSHECRSVLMVSHNNDTTSVDSRPLHVCCVSIMTAKTEKVVGDAFR